MNRIELLKQINNKISKQIRATNTSIDEPAEVETTEITNYIAEAYSDFIDADSFE